MNLIKPSGGTTLTHNAATTVTFPQDVDGVVLQNLSPSDVFVAVDGTAATAGSLRLPTGTTALSQQDLRVRIPAARGISVFNSNATTDATANAASGVVIWGRAI